MNTRIREETITGRIFVIRGQRAMIDRDIAQLYGVETKYLNRQVKRNIDRFPLEFMFRLTKKEKEEVVTNWHHLKVIKFSPSTRPQSPTKRRTQDEKIFQRPDYRRNLINSINDIPTGQRRIPGRNQ